MLNGDGKANDDDEWEWIKCTSCITTTEKEKTITTINDDWG